MQAQANNDPSKVWVVPKRAGMDLEKRPSTRMALIDPLSLPDLPQQYKDGSFYVVDQVVSRSELGVGVLQFEVSAGYLRSVAIDGTEGIPGDHAGNSQLQATTVTATSPAKELPSSSEGTKPCEADVFALIPYPSSLGFRSRILVSWV